VLIGASCMVAGAGTATPRWRGRGGDELSVLTGVPKSTIANKAKAIRDLLGLHRLDRELCRRELLDRHSFAWLVEVDGVIVDARRLPAPLQDEARRRGLIPDLPGTTAPASEAA